MRVLVEIFTEVKRGQTRYYLILSEDIMPITVEIADHEFNYLKTNGVPDITGQ